MTLNYTIFNTKEKEQLLKEIHSTVTALESTYSRFEHVTEPDLIDCTIFELNAIQKRYKFLLGQIKKIEEAV